MSTKRDELIVIHPQLNGDAAAIAEMARENHPTTIVPPDAEIRSNAASSSMTEIGAHETPQPITDRALAIDAFRGFFLLAMTCTFVIPSVKGMFPDWIYHMQEPAGQYVDRSGLTWQDVIFPGFLFTMCAAIPIANATRLAKGMPYPAIIWGTVKRFVTLYLFALIIGHVLPFWTHDYTKRGNIVAIIGFLACWPMFLRKPASWKQATYDRFKMVGWVAGAGILFVLPRLYGAHFDITHIDDIIQALAFVSLVTTFVWLFTRRQMAARVVVFGAVLALTVANGHGLTKNIFKVLHAPRFYEPWMIELLLIGIPGTIAGDFIVKWMRHHEEERSIGWSTGRLATLVAICLANFPVALVGFYEGKTTATATTLAALALIGVALVAGARTPREKIMANLFRMTALLLVAGALVVPFGGIKKDPQTLSYLLVTAGTALSFLLAAIITIDVLKVGQRMTRLFVEVGQNPLLAYVAFTMFFNNIGWLTPFGEWQQKSARHVIIGGLIYVSLTALLASAATRKQLFWRA